MMKEKLKQLRIAAKLSQRDVADMLGYSTPQFISNWERGLSTPPVSSLKEIARIYKCSARVLFDTYLEKEIEDKKSELIRRFERAS